MSECVNQAYVLLRASCVVPICSLHNPTAHELGGMIVINTAYIIYCSELMSLRVLLGGPLVCILAGQRQRRSPAQTLPRSDWSVCKRRGVARPTVKKTKLRPKLGADRPKKELSKRSPF